MVSGLEHIITAEQAASYAIAQLNIDVAMKKTGMVNWAGAVLGDFVTVYDLNGEPLFYDFSVISPANEPLGLVRAAASRVLGAPVMSVYLGAPRWNASQAFMKVTRAAQRKNKDEVVSTRLVCYDYPKIGVEVVVGRREEGGRQIIDVGDFSTVPEKVEVTEGRGPARGRRIWSFYEQISQKSANKSIDLFSAYDKFVEHVQKRSGKKLANAEESSGITIVTAEPINPNLVDLPKAFVIHKIISYCPHGATHECFTLHGQETNSWCTVATGQMILDFWRYYYSQSDIAKAMGSNGGTSWSGEEKGLESLTKSQFDAFSDFSPTFEKIETEINANRPFDYSYSYHSMACAGYHWYYNDYTGELQRSTYLYDPWPPRQPNNAQPGGTIRWETWGTMQIAGYVYLRRK